MNQRKETVPLRGHAGVTVDVEQGEAQNDSKLYPIGTIFVTGDPISHDGTMIRFWRVVRCSERTLWVQEVHGTQPLPGDRYGFPVRDKLVNGIIHMCRINLKANPERPIHIEGQLAAVWHGTILAQNPMWPTSA